MSDEMKIVEDNALSLPEQTETKELPVSTESVETPEVVVETPVEENVKVSEAVAETPVEESVETPEAVVETPVEESVETPAEEEAVAEKVEEKKKPAFNKVKAKKIVFRCIYLTVGSILSLIFLFPLIYMLATSTKSEQQYAMDAGTLMVFVPSFFELPATIGNYVRVLTGLGIWQYALNTFVYAGVIIVLNVMINGLAGYAMAKFTFPGKAFFSFIILFLIVVPVETSIIPLYTIVVRMLCLVESNLTAPLAVILPASISAFNIFLFMQFFEGIPKEYEEAARLDGAGTLRIFFSMILPLSKPIVATVATFCFIGAWNDYIWPTMVLPPPQEGEWPLYNIQAGLTAVQARNPEIGEVMASLVLASVPIFAVYVIAQKYIVQGFGSAGLKM